MKLPMALTALALMSMPPVGAQHTAAVTGSINGTVTAEVEKTGLMRGKKHVIAFSSVSGRVGFDPAQPGKASLLVLVKTSDFRVLDTWVSDKDKIKVAQLTRSADVLDAARHPEIRFESWSGFRPDGVAGKYRVPGMLTVRGRTQPVELLVTLHGLTATGTVTFSMSSFGIKPPSAALGAVGTRDEMTLNFSVSAVTVSR